MQCADGAESLTLKPQVSDDEGDISAASDSGQL
jgi:hypothetical protein